MRWRSASVAACSVLAVAGCGGSEEHHAKPPAPPRITADVAQRLAADADTVAARPGCAARDAALKLQTDVIDAIQGRRIPQRYREQLLSAANQIVVRIPECLPPRHDNGKHKGQKKHGKHGKGDGED
jgi:hypothetical protein